MKKTRLLDSEWIGLLEGHDLNIRSCTEGMFGGNRRSSHHGASAEFLDFREYVPGDDPRRIDWNLYGRFERLYLRLHVDERRERHQIMIDSSASMFWGNPQKHRLALQITALLGYLAVSSLDTVTYYALRDNRCEPVTDCLSNRDAWYLATEQLNQIPCGGDTVLDQAIASCPSAGYHDGITFVISDFLTDHPWKQGIDWLLEKKREVCLVRILSKEETAPSFHGRIQLLDSEAVREGDRRNRRMDINRQRIAAYQKACAWLAEDIRKFCASRNIRLLTCSTEDDLLQMFFSKSVEAGVMI